MRKSEKSLFVPFQPNPSWKGKGRYKHQDCSIRSICAATNNDWNTVYDMLCESGKQVYDVPGSDESIECCLKNLGFIRKTIRVTKGSKRPTVKSFAEEHKSGNYILRVSNHVVGVVNGYYYDCWDCGYCCVYSYYEKTPY